MDVKSSFLNGDLEEDFYIEKPKWFQLIDNPDNVCKLKKSLYVLKPAPRAWYYRLDKYLQDRGFKKGTIDSNFYIKSKGDNLLVILLYVDGVIFGCTNDYSMQWFSNAMQYEFEMSMIGESPFFLGLCIIKSSEGLFLSQEK